MMVVLGAIRAIRLLEKPGDEKSGLVPGVSRDDTLQRILRVNG